MRFEFCGKVDCPDWILAQIFYASTWDKRCFEIICQSVKETTLQGGKLNEDVLFNSLGLFECETSASNQENQLDIDDVRACFGAVSYILTGVKKYRVSEKQLRIELEHLGLATEHSNILCRHLI